MDGLNIIMEASMFIPHARDSVGSKQCVLAVLVQVLLWIYKYSTTGTCCLRFITFCSLASLDPGQSSLIVIRERG